MSKARIAGIVAGAVALTTVAVPAPAATVHPYFFDNSPRSNFSINLWSRSDCTGKVHPVYTGTRVKSDGWDCAQAHVDWDEWVYDVPSGKFLKHRRHKAFERVRLSNNRHFAVTDNVA